MILLYLCLEFQQTVSVLQSLFVLLGEKVAASSPPTVTLAAVNMCLLFHKQTAECNLGIWLSNLLSLTMSLILIP